MWMYNPIADFTTDELDLWENCGMTVPMAPVMTTEDNDPGELIPFLDRARDKEMSLIAKFHDLSFGSVQRLGEAEVERRFVKAYEALKGHPALHGFYAGDEPSSKEDFEALYTCLGIMKKHAPELKPYVNLVGNMPSIDPETLGGRTLPEWFSYIKEEFGDVSFSYDMYTPMINDDCIPPYFNEVKTIVESAEACGTPVWANALSSAHYAFRKPTEHELLWQITVSAACGCKGTVWFRFYDRTLGHEYFGSPIDEYGNKTDTYYGILRSQRRFNDHYGSLMLKLKRKSTFINGEKFKTNYPKYDKDAHDGVKVNAYDDLVISCFEDDAGREYMAVVNLSMNTHATVNFEYDTEKYALLEQLLNGEREGYTPPFAEWGVNLYAGQMRLYRIEKK